MKCLLAVFAVCMLFLGLVAVSDSGPPAVAESSFYGFDDGVLDIGPATLGVSSQVVFTVMGGDQGLTSDLAGMGSLYLDNYKTMGTATVNWVKEQERAAFAARARRRLGISSLLTIV